MDCYCANGKVLEGPCQKSLATPERPGKVREALLCMCRRGKVQETLLRLRSQEVETFWGELRPFCEYA